MQLRYMHGIVLLVDDPANARLVQQIYGHARVDYTIRVFSMLIDRGASQTLARAI